MLVLAVLLAATAPNPFLAEARVHYQGLAYDRCLKRLDQSEHWQSTVEEEAQVALYRGLCLSGQGRAAEARAEFERGLALAPTLELPAYTSPRIRAVFEDVRAEHPPSDAPRKPAELPPLVVAPTSPPAAPAAPALPAAAVVAPRRKGRKVAAAVVGGVGVAGLAAGVILGLRARQLASESFDAAFASEAESTADRARTHAAGANVGYGVAGASALTAGVLLLLDWMDTP